MKESVKRWAVTALFLAFVPAGCSVPPGPPVQDPVLSKRVFVDVKAAALDEVIV